MYAIPAAEKDSISGVVLLLNIKLKGRSHLGLEKTALTSEMVFILNGLDSEISLYKYTSWCHCQAQALYWQTPRTSVPQRLKTVICH